MVVSVDNKNLNLEKIKDENSTSNNFLCDKWQHVCLMYKKKDSSCRILLNGKLYSKGTKFNVSKEDVDKGLEIISKTISIADQYCN